MAGSDPFRHHPELRGRIKPAADSFFRDLDLASIDARAAAIGQSPDWRTPCEVREAERRAWLDGHWQDDLWVFGYGSLMWDPAMDFDEVRRARTSDYARSFCLWDDGGRGSPEHPGLMLTMDEGAGCEGLVFRLRAATLDHETFVLFRREMIAHAYRPVWLTLETDPGPVTALGFAADHTSDRIVSGIDVAEQARMIARAEGILGTNYDYLADTHAHLTLLGIEDPYISDLHARVSSLRRAA